MLFTLFATQRSRCAMARFMTQCLPLRRGKAKVKNLKIHAVCRNRCKLIHHLLRDITKNFFENPTKVNFVSLNGNAIHFLTYRSMSHGVSCEKLISYIIVSENY